METKSKLEDLPNIGSTLAELLRETGISSPEELYTSGTIQAFLKIKALAPDACFSKLCALEGAIEGIRWHNLSKEKKAELKHFFALISKDDHI
jgi:DNA transformation protein and related proteins